MPAAHWHGYASFPPVSTESPSFFSFSLATARRVIVASVARHDLGSRQVFRLQWSPNLAVETTLERPLSGGGHATEGTNRRRICKERRDTLRRRRSSTSTVPPALASVAAAAGCFGFFDELDQRRLAQRRLRPPPPPCPSCLYPSKRSSRAFRPTGASLRWNSSLICLAAIAVQATP